MFEVSLTVCEGVLVTFVDWVMEGEGVEDGGDEEDDDEEEGVFVFSKGVLSAGERGVVIGMFEKGPLPGVGEEKAMVERTCFFFLAVTSGVNVGFDRGIDVSSPEGDRSELVEAEGSIERVGGCSLSSLLSFSDSKSSVLRSPPSPVLKASQS